MPQQKIGNITVSTDYWQKPIPTSKFDWCAVDDDTYDGAPGCHCPIGYGATEQEAIDDLLQQIDEQHPCIRDGSQRCELTKGQICHACGAIG